MTGFMKIFTDKPEDHGRWGVTFLKASTNLREEERKILVRQSAEMYYLKDGDRRDLNEESFEGRLWTDGKYGSMGCFGGKIYNAELDMDGNRGRVKLSFLVSEQTGREKGVSYN